MSQFEQTSGGGEMRGPMGRKLASGAISRKQAARFSFGTTSENSVPLRLDDGGIWEGAIRQDHLNDPQYVRPRKGSGHTNPERDYGKGNFGVGHNDGNLTRPAYPGWPKQKDRSERASKARARLSSDSEYWSADWYGAPPRRQK
jgi:hypothetical protein